MADDLPLSPVPLDEPEYKSVYTYFNQTMGEEVPLYTFNPASVTRAAHLDRADWIRMEDALEQIRVAAKSSTHTPEEKLISALKAAAVLGIHGRVTRLPNGDFDRSYQYVYPRQWATCSGLNTEEDSISLHDGTPLVDIHLNRKDLRYWIEIKSNPDTSLKTNPDYLRRCDQRIHEIGAPNAELRFERKPASPNRGGRPPTYLWEEAAIHLLVNTLYYGVGNLCEDTSKADITRMLIGALNEIGEEAYPSMSTANDHANLIWNCFERSRASSINTN